MVDIIFYNNKKLYIIKLKLKKQNKKIKLKKNNSIKILFKKMNKIISKIIDILFIFAPNIGYIHQCLKINKNRDSTGFSKFISFILIIAYNIRFFFYFGEKFEITILYQAIFCFIMQLTLLYICIIYDKTLKNRKNSNYFLINQFWNWPYFIDYIFFISFFSAFMSFISNFFSYKNKHYIFILGLLTSFFEALLDIPQIIELYKNKNVKSLSLVLIMTWVFGDLFKFIYYIIKKAPYQLIGCAIFQLSCDFIIIGQVFYYNKKADYLKVSNTDEKMINKNEPISS
jgi:uncharacterized protein with PQ loop repeat